MIRFFTITNIYKVIFNSFIQNTLSKCSLSFTLAVKFQLYKHCGYFHFNVLYTGWFIYFSKQVHFNDKYDMHTMHIGFFVCFVFTEQHIQIILNVLKFNLYDKLLHSYNRLQRQKLFLFYTVVKFCLSTIWLVNYFREWKIFHGFPNENPKN